MRALTISATLIATPALAHHEVIVATSLLPALGGAAVLFAAVLVELRKKWRAARQNEQDE